MFIEEGFFFSPGRECLDRACGVKAAFEDEPSENADEEECTFPGQMCGVREISSVCIFHWA